MVGYLLYEKVQVGERLDGGVQMDAVGVFVGSVVSQCTQQTDVALNATRGFQQQLG